MGAEMATEHLRSLGHRRFPFVCGPPTRSSALRLFGFRRVLERDDPDSIHAMALMVASEWHWQAWGDLLHTVQTGESAFVHRCTVWMRERLRSESLWKCWIAESQDTAVGDVWVQLVEKIPNPIEEPEYYVYLTNFYVREQYRSHGIGSMMLSEILDWGRSMNIKEIILWPTGRSKTFYMRHGFATTEDLMYLKLK